MIVKDGKVLYQKGYGHDSDGKPLTEKSLMRLASVSKIIYGICRITTG
ncbi:serine hydrolase [Thermoactinomyces mirandus]|nr:serine hydrolase [Thermoactinomyces mirandus]